MRVRVSLGLRLGLGVVSVRVVVRVRITVRVNLRVVNFSKLWLRAFPELIDSARHDRSSFLTEQLRDPLE